MKLDIAILMEWGCKTKWYEKMELAEANLGAGPRICVIVHYRNVTTQFLPQITNIPTSAWAIMVFIGGVQ